MGADGSKGKDRVILDGSDVIVIWEGPDDTTVRPRPAYVPRWFPGREPPPELGLPPATERSALSQDDCPPKG